MLTTQSVTEACSYTVQSPGLAAVILGTVLYVFNLKYKRRYVVVAIPPDLTPHQRAMALFTNCDWQPGESTR